MTEKPPPEQTNKKNLIHLRRGYPAAVAPISAEEFFHTLNKFAASLVEFEGGEGGENPEEERRPTFSVASLDSLAANQKVLVIKKDAEDEDPAPAGGSVTDFSLVKPPPKKHQKLGGK